MRGTFRLSPPLKVNRPLAFSVLLAFLSLALVSGPVWREGQSKKVPPLSWEEFVETDSYKELPPRKRLRPGNGTKKYMGRRLLSGRLVCPVNSRSRQRSCSSWGALSFWQKTTQKHSPISIRLYG